MRKLARGIYTVLANRENRAIPIPSLAFLLGVTERAIWGAIAPERGPNGAFRLTATLKVKNRSRGQSPMGAPPEPLGGLY